MHTFTGAAPVDIVSGHVSHTNTNVRLGKNKNTFKKKINRLTIF